MNRKTLALISALALLAASPSLAVAKSIKHLVAPDSLASLCGSVGVDREVTAQVTMPNGDKVTGTIHCEAEDMTPGSDDWRASGVSGASSEDDGPSHMEDDATDDNGGDHHGGDDSGDDNGDHSGSGGGDGHGGGDDNGGDD